MKASMRLAAPLAAVLTALALGGAPALAAPPGNDTFSGAEVIAAVPFTTTQDTTEATTDADDDELNATCGAPAMDASVWFAFTAADDNAYLADASQSDYSTGVFVATGSPGSFEVLACGPVGAAWQATAGETYYWLEADDNKVSDDERDEDGDGLTNLDELHSRMTPEYWAACYGDENPYPIAYSGTSATDSDSDGDGILDGADDQDHDDVPNIMELSRFMASHRVDWDHQCHAASGKTVMSEGGMAAQGYYVAVSPDGKRAAAVGAGGVANVWKLPAGLVPPRPDPGLPKPTATLTRPDGTPEDVIFSPDGTRVFGAAQNSKHLMVWDSATGKELDRLKLPDTVTGSRALVLLPGGLLASCYGGDPVVRVWDLKTGELEKDAEKVAASGRALRCYFQ